MILDPGAYIHTDGDHGAPGYMFVQAWLRGLCEALKPVPAHPGLINPPGRILAVCVAGNHQPPSPGGRFSIDTLAGSAPTTVSRLIRVKILFPPPRARPSGQSPDTRPPASRESGQPQKTLSAAVIFGHQNREQTGSPWLHAAAREKEWFFQRVSSRLFTISQFTTLQNASMNCPRLFR